MTEIQKRLLDIVIDFDKVCKNADVEYYLIGGALIGALRHRGFVPWDDDIDVMMTRDNWKKLLRETQGKVDDYEFGGIDINPDAGMTVNHFSKKNTTEIYRFHLTNKDTTGAALDIFVLDPVPKEKIQTYWDAIFELQDFMCPVYFQELRNPYRKRDRKQYRKDCLEGRIKGKKAVIERITKEAFNYSENESDYYAERYGGLPLMYPKELMGKPQYVPFETISLPVPEHAEDVLTIAYGEWKYIPRGGSTKSVHEYVIRNYKESSKDLMNEYFNIVDSKQIKRDYNRKKNQQFKMIYDIAQASVNRNILKAEKVKFDYQKKLSEKNPKELLEARDYKKIHAFFEDYLRIQCRDEYLGSPSATGWKRWCMRVNPQLIDIGDDALETLLRLLIFEGKELLAIQLLRARENENRELSKSLCTIKDICELTRQAYSLYTHKEYEKVNEVIKQASKISDDIRTIDIIKAKMALQEDAPEESLKMINLLLEKYNDEAELLVMKAELLLRCDDYRSAKRILIKLIGETDNGLVLLKVRDLLSMLKDTSLNQQQKEEIDRMSISLKRACGECDESEMEDEEEVEEEQNDFKDYNKYIDIQKQLVIELDDICMKNNIELYLYDRYNGDDYRDVGINNRMGLFIRAEDVDAFVDAVYAEKPDERKLLSMKNEANYPSFSFRYMNTATTEIVNSNSWKVRDCGIFITIDIVRHDSYRKAGNKLLSMLERGWWMQFAYSKYTPKNAISFGLVRMLTIILGNKKTANMLFDKLLKGSIQPQGKEYIRVFKKNKIFLETKLEESVKRTYVGEHRMNTVRVKPLDSVYKQLVSSDSKRRKINHIIDCNNSYKEFFDFLESRGIDRQEIIENGIKYNKKNAKTVALNKKTSKYWDLLDALNKKRLLNERFYDEEVHLNELLEKEKYHELTLALADYYLQKRYFERKGIELDYCDKLESLLHKNSVFAEDNSNSNGLRQADTVDQEKILKYLRKQVFNCLYMYIDIAKYGVKGPFINVWIEEDDFGIKLVVMKYYNSISVFADNDNWSVKDVVELIKKEKVNTINGESLVIERLETSLSDDYIFEYGSVYRFDNAEEPECEYVIDAAQENDYDEIAELICKDEEFGSMYDKDNLAMQLKERAESGMGRSYIIRDEGKIIAHIASYAEFEGLSTTSGLVVDKNSQNGMLGLIMENYLINRLWDDGYEVYTFVVKKMRKRFLEVRGNTYLGDYGKLIRR